MGVRGPGWEEGGRVLLVVEVMEVVMEVVVESVRDRRFEKKKPIETQALILARYR